LWLKHDKLIFSLSPCHFPSTFSVLFQNSWTESDKNKAWGSKKKTIKFEGLSREKTKTSKQGYTYNYKI